MLKLRFRQWKPLLLAAIFILTISLGLAATSSQAGIKKSTSSSPTLTYKELKSLLDDNVTAKSCVLYNPKTKKILFSRNPFKALPPASLTKILTAITVIENTPKLDKTITIAKDIHVGNGGVTIGLKAGDKVTIRDLLYASMLYSANDACIALAKATCGSESKFLKKMNALARKIGAVNSNFRNTNGMPKNNHYTTAYDLALISAYAMKNPVFRQIVTTRYHRLTINTHKKSKIRKTPRHDFPLAKEIEADHKMPKVRKVKVKNRHKLLGKYSNIRGIKTGYTHAAGRCLSTAWGMHGTEAIVIILNSKNVVDDTLNLLGYHKDMTGMGKYAKR